MKKLSLDLEMLVVESFDTDEAGRAAGTVGAHAAARTDIQVDCGSYIDACPSRLGTCDFTCKASCWGACDAAE